MNHREEAVNWSRRYKANLDKLSSQELAKVAEVVRDLELRERRHGLSAGEKRMLDKARHLGHLLSDADAAGITHQPCMPPAGQADDRGQAEGTARSMAERLTDRARRVVVVLAEEEARMRGHDWIGTEHLLLGLIQDGNGAAIKALKSLGISLEAARQQVDEIIGTGQQAPRAGRLPLTPRSKKVLELSSDEAGLLGHDYVSTGHILLGLIRDSDGVAGQVLASLGADLTTTRQQVPSILVHSQTQKPHESLSAAANAASSSTRARHLLAARTCAPEVGPMSATVSIHMQATPPYFSDRCYYAPANQAFTIKFFNPVSQLKDNSPTSATLVISHSDDPYMVPVPGRPGWATSSSAKAVFVGTPVKAPETGMFSVPALPAGTYDLQIMEQTTEAIATLVVQ